MKCKRFSSSYTNSKDNYIIHYTSKDTTDNKFTNSSLYGMYCVVQNIIQRGEPTDLSEYLKTAIDSENEIDIVRFISNELSSWEKTIKGDKSNSNYPALAFYEEVLPHYLGNDFGFVRNLIIPEATFDDVIGEKTSFSGQAVDFYIPFLDTVIEIDGSSHLDFNQRKKDEIRDQELRRYGKKVIRIETELLKTNNRILHEIMSDLSEKIRTNEVALEYKLCLENGISKASVEKESIMRLQQTLLTCLMEQILSISDNVWDICIENCDVERIEELLNIAYEDLKLWLRAIANLLRLKISFPSIEIIDSPVTADIVLDFYCYKRYDDSCCVTGKKVCVSTDYYSDRDYYRVAIADTLTYEIDPFKNEQDNKDLQFILNNAFGYDSFLEGQLPIIVNILAGNDTVGILPTGAGKSLCYQFASLIQPGITVVVDPILSLMQDQKRSMRDVMHITRNEMVSSLVYGEEREAILTDFKRGCYQILWISPERFQSEDFRNSLLRINEQLNFCIAVIDEVHCLSEWGHDFRVAYLTLVRTLREYCPAAVLVGLTATASEFVLQDIRAEFGGNEILASSNIKASPSMDRKELEYIRINVRDNEERNTTIRQIVKTEKNNPGALFCPTVRGKNTGCEAMRALLIQKTEGKAPIDENQIGLFHGKLNQQERVKSQCDFLDDRFSLMICTKAFGMGVDKQNLRYTLHNSLPASVESFYQEAGRAGRDRKKSHCYIISNMSDDARNKAKARANPDDLLSLIETESDEELKASDLETTLYFMRQSHEKEENEYKYIHYIYKRLINIPVVYFVQDTNNRKDNYNYQNNLLAEDKQRLENALYKLTLLGLINGWTVKYDNIVTGYCRVKIIDRSRASEANILDNFVKYVRKYDPEFSLESSPRYLEIWESEGPKLRNVIQMLVRWTNENIVYQRLQRSLTMMEWCSKSVDDRTFRRYLEGYFRFNEETSYLEYIAHHPRDWQEWFRLFFNFKQGTESEFVLIDQDRAKLNHASLQRFLESYQNNTGLNYLDGLLQLYFKEDVSKDDLKRFESSLSKIKEMQANDRNEILRFTLVIASNIRNMKSRELLSQVLIDYFPSWSRRIYNKLRDGYSLTVELEKIAARMERMKWII